MQTPKQAVLTLFGNDIFFCATLVLFVCLFAWLVSLFTYSFIFLFVSVMAILQLPTFGKKQTTTIQNCSWRVGDWGGGEEEETVHIKVYSIPDTAVQNVDVK